MASKTFYQQFKHQWNTCFNNFKSAANSTLTIAQRQFRIVENYLIIKNQEYGKKRVTNCLDKALESQKVTLPFSNQAFNFNKIKEAEYIYGLNVQRHELVPHPKKEENEHFVIINGCPIVEGHSLFVPYLKQNHPQILTPKLFEICLEAASMLPGMKFGYNSQGSASSVNHFHLHIMPCRFLSQNRFYIEDINGNFIKEQNQVKVFHFEINYTHYFKISCERSLVRKKEDVTKVSMEIISTLIEENIPHNVVITDECTLFIVVRGYANQECKYGWLEYCGVFVAKTEEQFEVKPQTIKNGYEILKITQKSAINRLLGSQ